MTRIAVQVGATRTRVAADGRVVATLPGGTAVPDVLAWLRDAPVEQLVVVDAEGPVPAAVAVLAGAPGPAVVVDAGYDGTEVTSVRDGRIRSVRRVPVGGAHLDAATADLLRRAGAAAEPARRVREALSLLPEVRVEPGVTVAADDLRSALTGPLAPVVDAVVAAVAGSGPAPPVLLVGGVARTPLLAELLDAAGVADVRVAERPDCAAVVGALRVPDAFLTGAPVTGAPVTGAPVTGAPVTGAPVTGAPVTGAPVADVPAPRPTAAPTPATDVWLPPLVPAPRRRARVVLAVLGAVAAVVGLVAAGAALPEPAPPAPSPAADEVVQYGFAVRVPPGWTHDGGRPRAERILLEPVSGRGGPDSVTVERFPLGYSAGTDPLRARDDLRAVVTAAGPRFSGFDERGVLAGRPVVAYTEAGSAPGVDTDWYVLLDGTTEFAVGCAHRPAGRPAVAEACATVVGSVHRTA